MSSTCFDHLQEDGCIYSCGLLCFTCISIRILVGRSVCVFEHTVLYHNCMYNSLPENEPPGSKLAEDIKITY